MNAEQPSPTSESISPRRAVQSRPVVEDFGCPSLMRTVASSAKGTFRSTTSASSTASTDSCGHEKRMNGCRPFSHRFTYERTATEGNSAAGSAARHRLGDWQLYPPRNRTLRFIVRSATRMPERRRTRCATTLNEILIATTILGLETWIRCSTSATQNE